LFEILFGDSNTAAYFGGDQPPGRDLAPHGAGADHQGFGGFGEGEHLMAVMGNG